MNNNVIVKKISSSSAYRDTQRYVLICLNLYFGDIKLRRKLGISGKYWRNKISCEAVFVGYYGQFMM